MASQGLFGDIGTFVNDLFGTEPTFQEVMDGYDPNNWTEGFGDRLERSAKENATDVTEFLDEGLKYITGEKNFEWNSALQALQIAANKYEAEQGRIFAGEQAGLQRDFDAAEALKQREWTAVQNQIQREYDERMSNSAIQRQTADARKAGLNPYAVYGSGGAMYHSGANATGAAARSSGVTSPTAHNSSVGTSGGNMSNMIAGLMSTIGHTAASLFHTHSNNQIMYKRLENEAFRLDNENEKIDQEWYKIFNNYRKKYIYNSKKNKYE